MKMKRMDQSISLVIGCCIAIVLIVSELCGAGVIQKVMLEDNSQIIRSMAEDNGNVVKQWLAKQESILNTLKEGVEQQAAEGWDSVQVMDYLERVLPQNDVALMYYVCLADDTLLPADHSKIELDVQSRSWWRAVTENRMIFTDPYQDAVTGKMVVSAAAPLRCWGQKGALLIDFTIDDLVALMNSTGTGADAHAFLLTEDGTVITHENEAFLPSDGETVRLTDQVKLSLDKDTVQTYEDYDGKQKYALIQTIEVTGWKLGITRGLQSVQDSIMSNLRINLVIMFFLMTAFSILNYLMIRKMLRPINKVVEVIVKLSKGDLSVQIDASKRKDEMGVLQNAVATLAGTLSEIIGEANHILGQMAEYNLAMPNMREYQGDFDNLAISVNSIKNIMNQMLSEIQVNASGVDLGASQLASAADGLSQGTMAQAMSIQTLQTNVGDVTDRINRNSESCRTVNDRLISLDEEIRTGDVQMQELVHMVEEVEKMSSDIQKIVGAIDAIAFQTNILALNASVEAARAGDSGKGFAVVAEEVRNLAYKSSEESKKTAELIERCITAIAGAKKYADRASQCMNRVVTDSSEISEAFHSISTDTSQQAESVSRIHEELSKVSDVVQSNTATAQETAASSEELSSQALSLKDMVKKFQV